MNISRLKKITVLLMYLLASGSLVAQSGIDSPYSRFGIGQLEHKSLHPRLNAMGGIGNAIGSNTFVNYSNPASYARFDTLSFLFNAGLSAGSATLRTTTQNEVSSNARLAYITAGFPVTRWLRASVGLLPYTNVGYDIVIPYESELIGRYAKLFSGSGGLNRFYAGGAFKITDNFSAGFNATYVFGQNLNSILIFFPDSVYYANTKIENNIQTNSFVFDYGLLYTHQLGDDYSLTAGLTFGQQMKLSSQREYTVKSLFGGFSGGIEYVLDTIDYRPSEKGNLILPSSTGFGLVFQKRNNWLAGIDFNWQNWERFEAFGANDSLVNSWNIAVGGQFTPSHTSISKYWQRVTYRMGARYDQTYLSLRGEPLNEFGITFGLGLPFPRSLTTLDLSLEVGRRGTTANNLVQETFVNFTVGVSIYERWFVKRRYH
jgi:long-subunit fatty acid transport protein